jgi:hypothetical protein
MRSVKEEKGKTRVRVMMMGFSQMGRLSEEMNKRHGDKAEVIGCVRLRVRTLLGK